MYAQPPYRALKNVLALAFLVAYAINVVLFVNNGGEDLFPYQTPSVILGGVGVLMAVVYLLLSMIWMLTGRSGVGVVVVGVLALLGTAGVTSGVWNFVVDLRSSSYQETRGTILSSETQTETSTSYDNKRNSGTADRKASATRSTSRYFSLEYRYEVGGKDYRGTKYTTAEATVTEEEAGHLEAWYPPGREVTVYYDPYDPSTAVLKKGISDRSGPAIFVPLGLGVFLLLAAWLGWRMPTLRRSFRADKK